MENLLIMGISTRPMVNSALKLNYNTFSVSYFKTLDFINPFAEKHILHQEDINSNDSFNCGSFEENYSPLKLFATLSIFCSSIKTADLTPFSPGSLQSIYEHASRVTLSPFVYTALPFLRA